MSDPNEKIWIRHSGTGGEAEVLRGSLPIYRQSGWDEMPKKDVAAKEKAAADEQVRTEEELTKLGQKALGNEPPQTPEEPAKTKKES